MDRSRGNQRDRLRKNYNYYRNKRRSPRKYFSYAEAKLGVKENTDVPKSGNVKVKAKSNFSLFGKLTEETTTRKGVVIKYSESAEARKPKRWWRLYPFKAEKDMKTLPIPYIVKVFILLGETGKWWNCLSIIHLVLNSMHHWFA